MTKWGHVTPHVKHHVTVHLLSPAAGDHQASKKVTSPSWVQKPWQPASITSGFWGWHHNRHWWPNHNPGQSSSQWRFGTLGFYCHCMWGFPGFTFNAYLGLRGLSSRVPHYLIQDISIPLFTQVSKTFIHRPNDITRKSVFGLRCSGNKLNYPVLKLGVDLAFWIRSDRSFLTVTLPPNLSIVGQMSASSIVSFSFSGPHTESPKKLLTLNCCSMHQLFATWSHIVMFLFRGENSMVTPQSLWVFY